MQIESLSHSDKLWQVVARFMFVGEQYRGNRLSEQLILSVLTYAKKLGFDKVYLVSDHVNLYEKFGFVKIDEKEAPWGAMETIFMHLT